MAAESTSSLPIPGLDGGVSADQSARTDSHTLSNGITSGSQDSEGYASGSQTAEGQSSTAVGEGSSEFQAVGTLTEPEVRSSGESQGGAAQPTATDAVASQMSAPTVTQPSTEQSKDSTASTQHQQERPSQQSGSSDQSGATANSSAAPASSGDSSSSANNPQGLPGGQKRLHVSNLPFRFRDADLTRLFEPHGRVVEAEIIFNERGSKGFGFVTFDTPDEADNAKEKVNGSVIDGRKIEVNDATPRTGPKRPRQQPYGNEGGTYRYGRPMYGLGGLGPYGRPVTVMQPSIYDTMQGARQYGGYPQPEIAPSYQASYSAVSAYPGYPTDAYQSAYGQAQSFSGQYSQNYVASQQSSQQTPTAQPAQQQPQQQQTSATQQQQQQQDSYPSLVSGYGPVAGYQQQSYRYAPY